MLHLNGSVSETSCHSILWAGAPQTAARSGPVPPPQWGSRARLQGAPCTASAPRIWHLPGEGSRSREKIDGAINVLPKEMSRKWEALSCTASELALSPSTQTHRSQDEPRALTLTTTSWKRHQDLGPVPHCIKIMSADSCGCWRYCHSP